MKAPQREIFGGEGGGLKTFDQIWADALAASDKGSCFEQEKWLALDKDHV